jgi:peptidoglycan L-alanyl-D-glutamate endopeptidase CwlK
MAAPVALAVYNSAVLSGPGRAVKWLQQALNALGQNVDVDGEIGPQTLGAVGRVDARALAAGYFQQFEAFLRGLKNFSVFGKGWLNRLNDMRTIAASLPVEIPQIQTLPETAMTASADPQNRQILIALLIALLKARAEGKQGSDLINAILSGLGAKTSTEATDGKA